MALFQQEVSQLVRGHFGPPARIKYSRDELLALADAETGKPGSPLIDCEDYPLIKRRGAGEDRKLPYNWKETFNNARDVVRSSAATGGSPPAQRSFPHNSTANNHNNNNAAPNGEKLNFLDVLRPNAPRRVWNDELGEWVEAGRN